MHTTMQIYLPPILQSSQLLYTLSEIKRKNINNNVLISNLIVNNHNVLDILLNAYKQNYHIFCHQLIILYLKFSKSMVINNNLKKNLSNFSYFNQIKKLSLLFTYFLIPRSASIKAWYQDEQGKTNYILEQPPHPHEGTEPSKAPGH